jgi:RNA 2',3'-cyclic 3'-phosphodiesterase
MRTFVAIELGSPLRQAMVDVQATIKRALDSLPGARPQWVRPESLHLTLKFLGEIDEANLPDVLVALRVAAHRQGGFSLTVRGIGVFPDARTPKVLWAGLSGDVDKLTALAGAIDEALIPVGIEPEGRPFKPHLTIARIKDDSREIGKTLTADEILDSRLEIGTMNVQEIVLMKSDLKPSGSVYTRLDRVPLG